MAEEPPRRLPAAPRRPPLWEERLAGWVFRLFSPRLPAAEQPPPPARLAPWEEVLVPRLEGGGRLTGTWFEVRGGARGAVLLLHPWVKWGKTFFLRLGRIEALRAAGYHAFILDLSGFGGSSPPRGLYDRDVAAGLAYMRQRAAGLPLHVWGVSSGGFWAHLALTWTDGVAGAFFEDVSPHLIEWSWRMEPRLRPGYLLVHYGFPRFYRYLDLRRQAAAMRHRAAAYVGGRCDPGVRAEETLDLARRAGAAHLLVDQADHLGSLRVARAEVVALALATFRRAEEAGAARREPDRGHAATGGAPRDPAGAGR